MPEKEYIEREALQNKAFGENHPTFYDGQDIADWYEKCINETPAADVSPVRHGRWETISDSDLSKTVMCALCNKVFYFAKKGQLNIDTMPYCPNCGAKMDEKECEENACKNTY